MSHLEYATENEPQFDFCLWPYPAVKPCEGKLRSISLLAESFEQQGLGQRAMDVVLAIRQELGDLRTVWGIKQAEGVLSWEFYFYDYDRTGRQRSVARLLKAMGPWVSCDVQISDHSPYFMFSIDLSRELLGQGGELPEVQMYIGNIGSTVSSGICYSVSRQQTLLKNFYFFFDAQREMDEIAGKVFTSAFVREGEVEIDSILWPELRNCAVIVVANKPDRDGVYFSRITAAQLLWFLKKMQYPPRLIRFMEANMASLDHMLYDVGIDYRFESGRLTVLKSAYYGVF